MSHEKYQSCIDECNSCATLCDHCTTSCLNEKGVEHLTKCVQLNIQCAAICRAAAAMMSLGSAYSHHFCKLCAEICGDCVRECEKHDFEHCKQCAEACRKCAAACTAMSR